MSQRAKTYLTLCFCIVAMMFSCKKNEVENPYLNIVPITNDNPQLADIPVGNFAWLHGKIFKPTCANSGCHDGTFEPRFNTIGSAYNSLVNHPVIANDLENSFVYRVDPGNIEGSLLHERLTENIPNTSGIMPLQIDEGSDWDDQKVFYIEQIENWISNGAQDMFGNTPSLGGSDLPPQVEGLVIFPAGNTTTPYEREDNGMGITPIDVDAGSIDVWVRMTDDNTPIESMEVAELKFALSSDQFETAIPVQFQTSNSVEALDFSDSPTTFQHKATLDLSSAVSGETYFLRTYFDDGVQANVTTTPNDGSSPILIAIFVIKII